MINANIALILAQAGKKVLLVDLDMEKPGVGTFFGLDAASKTPGLSGLLSEHASLKDAVKPSGTANLSLLPASGDSDDLTGLLNPVALKKWVAEAKQKYDFIIFDGPPLLVSPESKVFATALDGVILLAYYGKTSRPDILEAVQQFRAARIPLWGTILNGSKG